MIKQVKIVREGEILAQIALVLAYNCVYLLVYAEMLHDFPMTVQSLSISSVFE